MARQKEQYETMNPKIIIRNETQDDVRAISEVTIAAFKTLEISHDAEQFIIEALRAAKALTVSLVAEADGRASVKQVNNYGPDRDAGRPHPAGVGQSHNENCCKQVSPAVSGEWLRGFVGQD